MANGRRAEDSETFSIPPTEEERERLMDPGYWDWEEPLEVVCAENPGLIIRVRLQEDDVWILGAAARAANMLLSRYLLHAALETARAAALSPQES
jgi:hypothetical protein